MHSDGLQRGPASRGGKNPILILAFNRPDKTRALIESILTLYQPERLYLAVDGPRPGKSGEADKVEAVRALADTFGKATEIRTLFQDGNLGCAKAVPAAISWFFEREEQGMIIEDDIEVSAAFFQYIDWCLQRFSTDERVLHISSFQPLGAAWLNGSPEIMINTHPNVWGWATWRRAWRRFDANTVHAPRHEMVIWIRQMVQDRRAVLFYWLAARMTAQDKLHSWGFRWLLSIARADGLCVAPRRSLVKNVGFGVDSTHTARAKHLENVALGEIDWCAKNLVGDISPILRDQVHLTTNRADSTLKLLRMWISTLLPNSIFFKLLNRMR